MSNCKILAILYTELITTRVGRKIGLVGFVLTHMISSTIVKELSWVINSSWRGNQCCGERWWAGERCTIELRKRWLNIDTNGWHNGCEMSEKVLGKRWGIVPLTERRWY